MLDQVREVLAKELRIDLEKITADSRISEDLGADSLDILQMLMTIEEKFDIKIPDEELAEFKTVQDIVDYLENIK